MQADHRGLTPEPVPANPADGLRGEGLLGYVRIVRDHPQAEGGGAPGNRLGAPIDRAVFEGAVPAASRSRSARPMSQSVIRVSVTSAAAPNR
jgi:hypothetical protein